MFYSRLCQALVFSVSAVFCLGLPLSAETVYTATFDPTTPGGWSGNRTGGVPNGSGGYLSGFASGTDSFRTGNYLYAQHQAAATTSADHFIRTGISSVDTTANPSLFATWLQSGSALGDAASYLTVQVGGVWYGSNDYSIANGEYTLDLWNSSWHAVDFVSGSTLTLDSGASIDSATLFAGGDIGGIGYYIEDLPGYSTTNVTIRLDNLRLATVNSEENNWLGIGGAGGNGNWNTTDGHWENGNYYKWGSSDRHAVFGGENDAGNGGTVTLTTDLISGSSVKSLTFKSNADGYIIKGDSTPRTMTLEGNILIDPAATVTFGENLTVRKTGSYYLSGGGTLVLENGAVLENTSSFVSILGGSTVEVKTGGVFSTFDTLLVGSTVVGGIDGTATLLVNGGTVNAATSTAAGGSKNFILGNRSGQPGDVTVTITGDGEIIGNKDASNGLVFENTGASSAYLNLDGGRVTVRRVVRSGSAPTAGEETQFNFNGGILRVDAEGGGAGADMANTNFAFLQNTTTIAYRVLAGGAIIDTNGRNVLIAAMLENGLGGAADGGFTKRGQGILQLHGNNTYNGKTTIEEGTLSIQDTANLGTGTELDIHDTATLRVTADVDLVFSGHEVTVVGDDTSANASIEVTNAALLNVSYITEEGTAPVSVTKKGDGTLALAGASTYTGKTTVEGGRLSLEGGFLGNGEIASPWIEVLGTASEFDTELLASYTFNADLVSGSGTFRGNYVAADAMEIKIGGTSTGNQGMANLADAGDLTGTLTFAGDLSLDNNTLYFQLGGTTQGTDYDHLDVGGTLTLTGDTKIALSYTNGFEAAWGQEFYLLSWTEFLPPQWGSFDPYAEENFDLPDLMEGWYWDLDDFMSEGVIRVVPEPGRMLLTLTALGAIALRRRRLAGSKKASA